MFEFLQSISDFFTTGIFQFFSDLWAYSVTQLIILYFKIQLEALKFSWGIAQGVISGMGVNNLIQNSWSGIPVDVQATLNFFRIPEAVNLLISAVVTRFVMSVIPGL